MIDELSHDLRYGVRLLARKPGFAAIAVLTLGLGIGVNSTVFTWAKAVVFDPLPAVANADRLVKVHSVLTGEGNEPIDLSYPDYRDFRESNKAFSGLAASMLAQLNLGGGQRPERIWGEMVSANFFDVLGTKPVDGRGFLPEEETNNRPVAVIGYDIWQRRFGGDPNVAGKALLVNNRSFTVIGVAPRRFQGSWEGLNNQIWVPICFEPVLSSDSTFPGERDSRGLQVTGRLRDGVSIQQAQADVSSIAGELSRQYPNSDKGIAAQVFPLSKEPLSAAAYLAPAVTALLIVAGLVLLIACANIANLLLVQGASRQKELAVRAAMGATRFRIVRQLLAEAVVLTLAGGTAALLFARWSSRSLNSLVPDSGFPIRFDLGIDAGALSFTAAATLLTLLLAALAPSLQSSKTDLIGNLKEGERGSSAGGGRARIRGVLVGTQVALSLVALISAGLMIRSLVKARSAYPGFNPDNVLVGTVDLFASGYNKERGVRFLSDLLTAMESQPGVKSVSMADNLPLRLVGGDSNSPSIEGYTPTPGEQIDINYDTIAPDYFKTMEIPIVAGRDFTAADDSTHPRVTIINQRFADRYFAGRNPLGYTLDFGRDGKYRIVGVARNVKEFTMDQPDVPDMYFPVLQAYNPMMTIIVRTSGAAATALTPLEDAIHRMDPNLPVFNIRTLVAATGASLVSQKLAVKLLTVFAGLALLLASVGIYGVIAYSVTQRRHEIGIRLALGASRGQMLALAIRGGMIPSAVGIAAGLGVALVLTRFMGDLLYGVKPWDPLTYLVTVAILTLVALAAAVIPGHRASKVDPMLALRCD